MKIINIVKVQSSLTQELQSTLQSKLVYCVDCINSALDSWVTLFYNYCYFAKLNSKVLREENIASQ